MENYIGIQTEGRKYAHLLKLHSAVEKALDFTTVEDFQTRVILKVFHIDGIKPMLLDTIPIEIPGNERAGRPHIHLYGMYNGKRRLNLSITLNGKLYTERALHIKKSITLLQTKWFYVPIGAALCGLVLLIFIGTTNHESRRYGAYQIFAGIKQQANTPAAPVRVEEKHTSPTVIIENVETSVATVDAPASEQPEQVSQNSSVEEVSATEPIVVKDSVYFASSRAELNQATRNTLLRLLVYMNEHPEAAISITGHCALAGTERGRSKLSYIRAKRVHEFLRSNGLRSGSEPVIIGMGSKVLVTTDPGQQHLNRRVEIVIGSENK